MAKAEQQPLKTPLYDSHVEMGGRMVEFAGYLLPVQYPTCPTLEHAAVRNAAGLFDIDHMGQFELTGPVADGAFTVGTASCADAPSSSNDAPSSSDDAPSSNDNAPASTENGAPVAAPLPVAFTG